MSSKLEINILDVNLTPSQEVARSSLIPSYIYRVIRYKPAMLHAFFI